MRLRQPRLIKALCLTFALTGLLTVGFTHIEGLEKSESSADQRNLPEEGVKAPRTSPNLGVQSSTGKEARQMTETAFSGCGQLAYAAENGHIDEIRLLSLNEEGLQVLSARMLEDPQWARGKLKSIRYLEDEELTVFFGLALCHTLRMKPGLAAEASYALGPQLIRAMHDSRLKEEVRLNAARVLSFLPGRQLQDSVLSALDITDSLSLRTNFILTLNGRQSASVVSALRRRVSASMPFEEHLATFVATRKIEKKLGVKSRPQEEWQLLQRASRQGFSSFDLAIKAIANARGRTVKSLCKELQSKTTHPKILDFCEAISSPSKPSVAR